MRAESGRDEKGENDRWQAKHDYVLTIPEMYRLPPTTEISTAILHNLVKGAPSDKTTGSI